MKKLAMFTVAAVFALTAFTSCKQQQPAQQTQPAQQQAPADQTQPAQQQAPADQQQTGQQQAPATTTPNK